ncbi:MAG: diguanylate cyclase [Anaerolineaceae bacterium]|jgi:diguanylate cyclase (GGDEF)-like protein|nr:diguanylate cyclase [Anaerolineaceae bacterium]
MMNFFYNSNQPGLVHESEIVQRINSLNAAALDMISLAPKEGLDLSKRAYQLATSVEFQQDPYPKGVADALFNMSHFHLEQGDTMLALAQAKEALQIYIELNKSLNQSSTLRLLGMIYLLQNEYNKAMTSLLKALELARHLPDPRLLGEITLTIGQTYLASGEFEPALTELKKAIALFQNKDLSVQLSFAYNYLASVYKMLGDYEVFDQYLRRSAELADDLRIIPVRIDNFRQNGQSELRKGNLDAAGEYFEQARQLAEHQGYQTEKISCDIWLSEVDHYRGNLDAALERLLSANARAQSIHYEKGCLRADRKLAQVYAELSDYRKAYDHFQSFYQIEQRIKREKNDLKFMTLETIVRTEALQKEARIIQNKNDQIEKEISERKWVEEALRQSEDKYRRVLNLDATTTVNTLRYFYDLAEQEIQRVNRYPHPLSVLIMDIDQFSAVNKRFGFVIGDQVLQWVARRLKDLLRVVDVIGRYGGDAFIMLLPETDLENALIVANRICRHFADADFEVAGEKLSLAFHGGLAEYEKDMQVDVFIQRANQALEAAQHSDTQYIVQWKDI